MLEIENQSTENSAEHLWRELAEIQSKLNDFAERAESLGFYCFFNTDYGSMGLSQIVYELSLDTSKRQD